MKAVLHSWFDGFNASVSRQERFDAEVDVSVKVILSEPTPRRLNQYINLRLHRLNYFRQSPGQVPSNHQFDCDSS
jgi:hypothetical protein